MIRRETVLFHLVNGFFSLPFERFQFAVNESKNMIELEDDFVILRPHIIGQTKLIDVELVFHLSVKIVEIDRLGSIRYSEEMLLLPAEDLSFSYPAFGNDRTACVRRDRAAVRVFASRL